MKLACGGDNWANVVSLHTIGSETAGQQTGSAERWQDVATGRYAVRWTWPDHATDEGFDGITAWHQGRSRIAYAFGDLDASLVANDEAYRTSRAWWFPNRHPATVAMAAPRTEAGRTFDVIDVTPEGGRPFQAWIDHATHLLARVDEQQAEDRVVTSYSDYRPVNGLMLPFSIRTGDGENPSFDAVETVTAIQLNQAVPHSLYDLPPLPPVDVSFPPGQTSVQVPFTLTASNVVLVPLTINGTQTVQAEFDSGGNLILQPATVQALHLKTEGRLKQGGGGEGFATTSLGRLDSVAFGGAVMHDVSFHSSAYHPEAPDRALVGLETLQRFVIRLDFDRSVLTLTEPNNASYPDTHSGVGAVVPFHFQDNQPEVIGSIDGIAGRFNIDTGDGGSLLLIAPFARRYGLIDRYRADLPYAGRATGATKGVWARQRVATVAINGPDGRPLVQAHDPVTRISLQNSGYDANRDVSANIGLGILKQFILTFDYPRQRIIFEPNHLYGLHDTFTRAGLRMVRGAHGWVVSTVYRGGPAEQAGVKEGDKVSMIDDRPADAMDLDAIWEKLRGPEGAMLKLRLGSSPADVAIRLHDML